MRILARGEHIRTEELKQKLAAASVELTCIDDSDLMSANVADFDIIFDLNFDDHPEQYDYLAKAAGKIVFVSAVKLQLAALTRRDSKPAFTLVGMNAIPGFINRDLAELSLWNKGDMEKVKHVMGTLNWDFKLVEDRVGMVTPRILFMIINEACYTVQEGTASMADIDTSMKLGTNYPFGPFEWADKIGIRNLYETLESIYLDTHDERYKICPLLKTHYLRNQPFLASRESY